MISIPCHDPRILWIATKMILKTKL